MAATRERASVIMMRGSGEKRLRDAIMQGLVREEITKDVEELLQQVECARGEYDLLLNTHRRTSAELEDIKNVIHEAVIASKREERRKTRYSELRQAAIRILVIFLIVLVSTAISRAIFG